MTEPTSRLDAEDNPFVGPRSIPEGMPLFGRDRETRDLYRVVVADRVVLLHAPSGAGKSSLVNAGLIPLLKRKRFRVWPVVRVNTEPPAGRDPATVDRYTQSALAMLGAGLHAPAASVATLLDFFAAHAPGSLDAVDQVLVLDQFEEVLTTDPDDVEGKSRFVEGLGRLLKYPGFHAVFSIRDEYVGALEPYRKFIPRGFETRFRLDLLTADEAAKSIVGPAADTSAPITPGAAKVLVDDLRRAKVRRRGQSVEEVGAFVEPVQLQVVCFRLWDRHQGGGPIGEDLVRGEAGDVDAALAAFYAAGVAAAVARAPGRSERRVRDWCEQRLVTSQGTRGQVQEGDGSLPPEAIEALIDARVVRAEQRRGLTWYELSHDRLIDPVQRDNAAWRESRLQPWQRQAELHAVSRRDELLVNGADLAAAQEWAAAHPDEVSDPEREYLDASARHETTERRARRLRRLITALVALSFLVVMPSAVLLYRAYVAAKAERDRAQESLAEQLLDRGLGFCQSEKTREGLHWFVNGLRQLQGVSTPKSTTLERLIREELSSWALQLPKPRQMFGQGGPIRGARFSPDGRRVLTYGRGKARLWDAETGMALSGPMTHPGDVGNFGARFSPDGRRVLTYGRGEARVWDAESAQPLGDPMPSGPVASFSPDGRRVLTYDDESARVWDAETGMALEGPMTHPAPTSGARRSGRTAGGC
jgi:hypothetical protein